MEFKDIHYLSGCNPLDSQYSRYLDKPGILAAGYKLVDCYSAICQARLHLEFYDSNNYGDLIQADDETSKLWVRFQLILDAVMYYNITIDLSWQVVWSYYTPSSLEILIKNKYEQLSKECSLKKLNILLNDINQCHDKNITEIKKTVNNFFNDELVVRIRDIYNYNKHRGGYHTPGLGANYKYLMISLGGNRVPVLSRRELDIKKVYDDLIILDSKIVDYIELLYKKLLPDDYLNSNVDFDLLIKNYKKIVEYTEDSKK